MALEALLRQRKHRLYLHSHSPFHPRPRRLRHLSLQNRPKNRRQCNRQQKAPHQKRQKSYRKNDRLSTHPPRPKDRLKHLSHKWPSLPLLLLKRHELSRTTSTLLVVDCKACDLGKLCRLRELKIRLLCEQMAPLALVMLSRLPCRLHLTYRKGAF